MRISKLSAILASTILFLAPAASFADTYQIFDLHSDQGYFFDGMDDAGHVVVDYNGTGTYYTYLNGISTASSTTAPTFTFDNGTPCTPAAPAGASGVHGVCNNGLDAFTAFPAGQSRPSIYAGPTYQDIFPDGGGGQIFMDSLGDVVFDNTVSGLAGDQWYEAIDLTTASTAPVSNAAAAFAATTPEPASLLLLSTGLLAPIFFLLLRRRRAAATTL